MAVYFFMLFGKSRVNAVVVVLGVARIEKKRMSRLVEFTCLVIVIDIQ